MNQNLQILAHLDRFGSITSLEAMNAYGILRLASRISDLRHSGHPIGSEYITVKNRYGEETRVKKYFLVKENYSIIRGGK